ncbi:Nif3-like dinuclear metal center hexameric protein [Ruminococcus flavefaciens]|uniref:Nif3-like dinuclear metal center hexameric protein n=1 Tax=Ruminococcus flavefaciens TaxID=1265 RepID=UPI0004AD8556|nr:Nif3-like dinuclear metal center hexameric protein [Ruminococcus flavefaciens]
MLDNRLKKIAELVSGEGIAVDVGTDHAYLAAELVKSGKCSNVIASDVKEGPLEAARNTVEKYGVKDSVELVLSDGLDNVDLTGVTDIIIAGMGGETIADIMERVAKSGRANEETGWILQPMTKPEVLRKKLYECGFVLWDDIVVEEGDKLYNIMKAEYDPNILFDFTETESIMGHLDEEEPVSRKYLDREAERCLRVAESLKNAGKISDAQHYEAIAAKLKNGIGTENVSDIAAFLDSLYPFGLQEKWDNSGYLVECPLEECRRILLALDITNEVVDEAFKKNADLIISHHPVIFDPRKRIMKNDPVYRLITDGIGAICMHTNLDIAQGGTNGVILSKLREKFSFECEPEPFEELGGENNLGWIITLEDAVLPKQLAEICREIFGCEYVRISKCRHRISRIAFCSGSGGSMLGEALEKSCDALITGDVKHDVWIDANNSGIVLLDCGHFHTENIVLWELRRVLEEKFPQLDIEISGNSIDPCEYV